jgi:transcriptional regulator with XRE-family HTH domain
MAGRGDDKLSATKKIKILLVEREMTLTDLSKRLNKSLSTMSEKMTRDNFSEKELKKIAEALNYDYDIIFTDKDTGKTI